MLPRGSFKGAASNAAEFPDVVVHVQAPVYEVPSARMSCLAPEARMPSMPACMRLTTVDAAMSCGSFIKSTASQPCRMKDTVEMLLTKDDIRIVSELSRKIGPESLEVVGAGDLSAVVDHEVVG